MVIQQALLIKNSVIHKGPDLGEKVDFFENRSVVLSIKSNPSFKDLCISDIGFYSNAKTAEVREKKELMNIY